MDARRLLSSHPGIHSRPEPMAFLHGMNLRSQCDCTIVQTTCNSAFNSEFAYCIKNLKFIPMNTALDFSRSLLSRRACAALALSLSAYACSTTAAPAIQVASLGTQTIDSIPSVQAPAAVIAVARQFLMDQLSRTPGATGPATVVIDAPRAAHLDHCDQMTASFPPGAQLRARVTVAVRCALPNTWTTYLQATVSQPVRYFVAAQALSVGQVITSADLTAQNGDLTRMPQGAVTDARALIGMQSTFRVAAGRPIVARGLRNAGSVTRGQSVRIVAKGNGFTITNEGQVLSDAAPGAPVQVRTSSGQTLTAIVKGPGPFSGTTAVATRGRTTPRALAMP